MTDPRRPDEPEPPDDPADGSGARDEAERGKPQAVEGGNPLSRQPADDDASEASATGHGPASGDGEGDKQAEHESAGGESTAEPAGSGAQPGERTEEGAGPSQPAGSGEFSGAAGEAAATSSEDAGTGAPPPGPPGEQDGRRQRWLWAGATLGLIALIALGGLAAALVQLSDRVGQLEGELSRVPERRAEALAPLARQEEVQSAVERLESRLGERIEALEQQGSEATRGLTRRMDELEKAFATVRELAGRNQVDWRMAEVHYLLAVAARRLAIAGDRRGAIAALEAADRSLSALGDVRLLELRASIIDDITAVRQVEAADVEGIALRLQALLERIPELSPARTERRADVAGDTQGDSAGGTAGGWWAALRERISRYIVVRRQPDGSGPARPQPDASLPGGSRLAFALSEARQAALRQDADGYQAAIQRARGVLDEAFAADSPTTRRFADMLERLAERAVVTTYPDLTTTLEQAKRVSARLRTEREAGMPREQNRQSTQQDGGGDGTESGDPAPGAAAAEGSREAGGGEE